MRPTNSRKSNFFPAFSSSLRHLFHTFRLTCPSLHAHNRDDGTKAASGAYHCMASGHGQHISVHSRVNDRAVRITQSSCVCRDPTPHIPAHIPRVLSIPYPITGCKPTAPPCRLSDTAADVLLSILVQLALMAPSTTTQRRPTTTQSRPWDALPRDRQQAAA